ncbi:MAG: low molecular weight protein-tyrosine-phosphatase [Thiohalomonadales bacterium]
MEKVQVLFVCMGNICRSPTAEGVFQKMVDDANLSDRLSIDSAGTHAYHVSEPPDPRAQSSAKSRGYDLSYIQARRVKTLDFDNFVYLIAMDKNNLDYLESICPPGREGRLSLFMSYAPDTGVAEVPDPYYGGNKGFEYVLDLIEAASRGLLSVVQDNK